jgi:hypothetical protein
MANTLVNCGDLPVVSVTHRPVNFGRNICVGAHPACYYNEFRQIQIGLQVVETPYVLTAEADCLYPPDYFRHAPDEAGKVYRYDNVWVLFARSHGNHRYHLKGYSDGAQMVDRLLWLGQIERKMGSKIEWVDDVAAEPPLPWRFRTDGGYTWTGDPVISFKTRAGVRSNTALKISHRGRRVHTHELPHWGKAQELKERMFA